MGTGIQGGRHSSYSSTIQFLTNHKKVTAMDGGKVYRLASSTDILLHLQGREGVEQILQILKDEFKLAMMLSGRVGHITVV